LSLVLLVLAACSGSSQKPDLAQEMAARSLGKRAINLENAGNYLEAAKIFKLINEKYGDTKYYAELGEQMLKRGISIQDPLASHTSIKMFKLQNMILRYKKSKGEYPKGHAILVPLDVWGNPLVYKIADDESKSYEFLVMSKGPDGKEKTNDDMYIIYSGKKSGGQSDDEKNSAGARSGRVSYSGEDPLMHGLPGKTVDMEQLRRIAEIEGGRPSSGDEAQQRTRKSRGNGKPKERVVTLDELLKGGQ